MSKPIKDMVISEIQNQLGDTRDMLLVDVSKVDGVTANRFRLALQEKKISLLTVRNTLARRALNSNGVTALDAYLKGPSTLIWGGQDVVALSKEIAKWAKDIAALEIKGGTVEGSALGPADVESLSKSPSREELISMIAGMILSPGGKVAAAILGPGGRLASQIKKIGGDGDEADAPAAAAEEPGAV